MLPNQRRNNQFFEVSVVTTFTTLDSKNASFVRDRKSTRLNSSHVKISYAVYCLKKKWHNTSSTAYSHVTGSARIILMMCRLPRATLFPYTTLFRSFLRLLPSRFARHKPFLSALCYQIKEGITNFLKSRSLQRLQHLTQKTLRSF